MSTAAGKTNAATAWLQYLSLPPAMLAMRLAVSTRPQTISGGRATGSSNQVATEEAHVAVIIIDGAAIENQANLADVLLEILAEPGVNNPTHVNAMQALLLSLVSMESAHAAHALLIIPVLRRRDDLLRAIVAKCCMWAEHRMAPLAAMSIVSGIATPTTSADVPAAYASCALVRACPCFAQLLAALPDDMSDGRSSVILSRFWDAILGTPPQSTEDSLNLSRALVFLADSPNLNGLLSLILGMLRAGAVEPNATCRYGSCAPLLRIIGALLGSSELVDRMGSRGLLALVGQLLEVILILAAESMLGLPDQQAAAGGASVAASASGVTVTSAAGFAHTTPIASMHDLLASMALNVLAGSVKHPSLVALYEASCEGPLDSALRKLLQVAVARYAPSRHSIAPLAALSASLSRLYSNFQISDAGRSLLVESVGDSHHIDEVGKLVRCSLSPCAPEADATTASQNAGTLLPTMALPADLGFRPCDGIEAITCVSILAPAMPRSQLPRAPDSVLSMRITKLGLAGTSYPLLPPSQGFQRLAHTVVKHSSDNFEAMISSLPEPTSELSAQLEDGSKCVPLSIGINDRQLIPSEALPSGSLAVEFCGEIVTGADEMVANLERFKAAAWPQQLCFLRAGNACPLAIDISRACSFARFAEHCSDRPTCEFRTFRTYDRSTARWVPRVCLLALRNLNAGEALTCDYTAHDVGRRDAHIQADALLQIERRASPVVASLAPQRRSVVAATAVHAAGGNDLAGGVHLAHVQTTNLDQQTTNSSSTAVKRPRTEQVRSRSGPQLPGTQTSNNAVFCCIFPGCEKQYMTTDSVRKHCRKVHAEWLAKQGQGSASLYSMLVPRAGELV